MQSVGLGGNYSLTPNLLLDGNLGYTRIRLQAENVDIAKNYGTDVLGIPGTNGSYKLDGGYPNFSFSNTYFSPFGNSNVSNPFLFRDNEYVGAVNLTWIKGSHSIRFGGEYQHFAINHFQPQTSFGPRGGFNFSGGVTSDNGGPASTLYNAWADFLLGAPQSMGISTEYINPATVREANYGFYARDQWQLNRKLTINYGLRYEAYPLATRDHYARSHNDLQPAKPEFGLSWGGVSGQPHDCGVNVGNGEFVPRVGIAYRLSEKTVFRIGYGLSADPNSYRAMRDAYPATIALALSGANSYQAAGSLATGLPPIVGPTLGTGPILLPTTITTTTYPLNYRRGYIQSLNVTLQHEIAKDFNAQAAFVQTRAIRHTDDININAAGPGGGNAGRAYFAITGQTTDITESTPFNTSNYNALQTQLTKRVGAGLVGATYTYSKALDYGDNDDSGLTWAWAPMYQRNYALAGFDRTHNLEIYGNYELPAGRGKRWVSQGFASKVVGGWQLNGILSRQSGTPLTISSSGTSVNAPGNTQTANQILANVAILGGHGIGANGGSYFNPLAFAAPSTTTAVFGNSGRDIVRGPGVFNVNASLFRNFAVTERFKLQFRVETFNLTNTPQLLEIPASRLRPLSCPVAFPFSVRSMVSR